MKKSPKQENSAFTAVVYFKKGRTDGMKFHSDKYERRPHNGQFITDHEHALQMLQLMIGKTFYGTYKTAIIYENKTGGVVAKYTYDQIKVLNSINWRMDGKGIYFSSVKPSIAQVIQQQPAQQGAGGIGNKFYASLGFKSQEEYDHYLELKMQHNQKR